MNIRNRLSDLSKCRAIILGKEYDLKHVNDILHAIEKRQELWRYCDASSHTIREWQQTVFKKVTLTAFITMYSCLIELLFGYLNGFVC